MTRAARPTIEPLEPRVVLSVATTAVDGGNTFAAAANLGRVSGTLVVNNALSGGESSDYFRFTVRSRGNVNVSLGGLSANANLRLLNADGATLSSSGRARSRSESISRSLGRGTYTLAVDRGKRAADTPYKLTLQADLNSASVAIDGATYTLSLNRADGSTAPIVTDRETWVVIHGWLSTPSATHRLADAIDASSKRNQVLELDWSQAALDENVVAVALRVADIGAWAAAKLNDWGIPGGLLNLAGHSFGGYMTDEIARRISGGVDRIVALDPATPSLGGFDLSGTNYAVHSKYSIAFVGSDFGNLPAAATADETINVNVGDRSSLATHGNVRELFTTMTEQNNGRNHDRISPRFSLKAIRSASAARPFLDDALGDGVDASIGGRRSGGTWTPGTLTYADVSSGTTVTRDA